ncbi:hypothetical protein HELRODRAFT_163542 [Helobdella robusta]|uniref:Uncharacterized protein n=1 Tax=Helobdella robusta TaxID=6412 RepID=T1EU65_HELRO|nr:hypothetical protein HELRODRAFT_163542 [Helobdella robusta]ESN96475.1 hypothetical protein HELRODRAFT_163542 [Helobdella robusta]
MNNFKCQLGCRRRLKFDSDVADQKQQSRHFRFQSTSSNHVGTNIFCTNSNNFGTTTFAMTAVEQENNYIHKWIPLVVCYDQFMPKILYEECEDSDLKNENANENVSNIDSVEYHDIETLFMKEIQNQLKSHCDISDSYINTSDNNNMYLIALDDNMWLRSMRHQVYQVARKYTCSMVILYFPVDVETSLQRNSKRKLEDRVSDSSIIKMANNLEKPDSIYKWERFTFIWNGDSSAIENNFADLMKMIEESMDHRCCSVREDGEEEEEKVRQSRVATLTNIIHQSDIILRKLLSNHMSSNLTKVNFLMVTKYSSDKNLDRKEIARKAGACNDIKNKIRSSIKSCEIHLPLLTQEDVENSSSNENSLLYKHLKQLFTNLLDEHENNVYTSVHHIS